MVIHPRNLNLGERILRFAEWPPRGKQLVGPAAAAAAAPRRPPAGSPGPPAAPGRPAGSTGPAAPPGPLLLPGRPAGREHGRALASFPSPLPCTGRPRVGKRGFPVSQCEARPGPHRSRPWGGRTEGRTQVPDGAAPWAPPRPRLLLWRRGGRDRRRSFPRSAFTPRVFVSPKPLSQKSSLLLCH